MKKQSLLPIFIVIFFASIIIKNDHTVAEDKYEDALNLYWTDRGISPLLWGEPTGKMKLGDSFTTHNINPIIPNIDQKGQILIPMPSDKDLPKTEQGWNELSSKIYTLLKEKIKMGLDNNVKDFEIRTVQNINIPGYLTNIPILNLFLKRQQNVIRFTKAFVDALGRAKEDFTSGSRTVTVSGICGSNCGYAAAKVISRLDNNPVDRIILVDARAYVPDVKGLYEKVTGNLVIINTAGDAPAYVFMVANHDVACILAHELPGLKVIWVDAKGLNLLGADIFVLGHLQSINSNPQIEVVKVYNGSGYTKLEGIKTRPDLINSLLKGFKIDKSIGGRKTFEPVQKTDFVEQVCGPLTNFLGRISNSNWIGADRSGRHFAKEYERDKPNRRPLGDTTIPGIFPMDEFARQHDIQDWVNWHSPAGTEVRVKGPDGRVEYYKSQGRESGQHDKWVIERSLGFRKDDLWRQAAEHPERVTQLEDLRKQFPINNNAKSLDISSGLDEVYFDPFLIIAELGDKFDNDDWKKYSGFPPPPPPPPSVSGVSIDPQPSKAGKGGSKIKEEVLKSRPSSEDTLSWPVEIPEEPK